MKKKQNIVKKAVSILLSMCVTVCTFSACSSKNSTDGGGNSTLGGGDSSNSSDNSTDAGSNSNTGSDSSYDLSYAVTAGETAYSNDDIKITVEEITGSGFDTKIRFSFENKTDRDLVFFINYPAVNGIVITSFMSIAANAGETADGTLVFDKKDLEYSGISEVATVDCRGNFVYHRGENGTEYLYRQLPIAVKTPIADTYVQPVDDKGEVIYSYDGFTLINMGTTVVHNKYYDEYLDKEIEENYYQIKLLLKSDTDKSAYAYFYDCSASGISMEENIILSRYCSTYGVGTVGYGYLRISQSDVEYIGSDASIEDVESITFTVELRSFPDMSDESPITMPETITVKK